VGNGLAIVAQVSSVVANVAIVLVEVATVRAYVPAIIADVFLIVAKVLPVFLDFCPFPSGASFVMLPQFLPQLALVVRQFRSIMANVALVLPQISTVTT